MRGQASGLRLQGRVEGLVELKAELVKTFRFDAAHALPNVPAGHKCAAMHGHSYRVDVHVTGTVQEHAGWLMDYARITAAVRPLIEQLDHHDLGKVSGLANSTSENICQWLWQRIRPELQELSAIVVWESETARCIYRGD